MYLIIDNYDSFTYNLFQFLSQLTDDEIMVVRNRHVTLEQIENMRPDGIIISNGPGDPEPVTNVVSIAAECMGSIPLFGICLGHQILGIALGGETYKLKFGHHGGNHPVKDMRTGSIAITVQNHNFCVDADSLNRDDVEITHINLNDNTVEGLRHRRLPVFSVQFHPEARPGPNDSKHLFDEFVSMVQKHAEEN